MTVPSAEQDRRRVVIEGVVPEIDGGRFPIKRTVGEEVVVEADIFADGHDVLAAQLLYRHVEEAEWRESPLAELENDRWRGVFVVDRVGRFLYTLRAWVERRTPAPLDPRLGELMAAHVDLEGATTYQRELEVVVDPERARFGAWYEFFPRSCVEGDPAKDHATLRDCASRLEYVADMGFDVVYLPPIHPVGHSHRKGPNNDTEPAPADPGSPWAIGSEVGGHDAIEPRLGSPADLRTFIAHAGELGLQVALDLAYQCSPDHPWVAEHPEWFRRRPDGTVQYAENPPKKYEDIYPIDFDTSDWRRLWQELARIVFFWVEQGVSIFRVDNPHTKPFAFWEWLIRTVKAEHPDVIFLSEAFTRPKVMYRLAKVGFTQSYTYFTWRNTKWELTEYFTELTHTQVGQFFRPNLWPNTPDILTEYLQIGGRPAFAIRLILAATLGASYGIYGPAFELCENEPREPGGEEYLDSEKFQVRRWDLDRPGSLRPVIALVNRARRENPALQSDRGLLFHHVDNDQLICFSKQTPDAENVVIVVVNLDPFHAHHGWVHLDLRALGLDGEHTFEVHDLLGGAHYLWQGPRNYVELDPHTQPAHLLRVSSV